MEIVFFGTGAGVPSRERNVASLALRLPESSETWLFDCGEGTQHRVLVSPVSFSRIRRIFITHLHGDHIFGLPGLLASAGLAGHPSSIDIYGPAGLGEFLESALRLSQTNLRYPIEIHEVDPGNVLEVSGLKVLAALLNHGLPSYGFRIDEPPRPGRFDSARAAELGVPNGPLFGRLKSGETVQLADGRLVGPEGLTGEPETGRSIAICGDTAFSDAAIELARGCDLLVHEATFAECDAELATISGHSTASSAARVAAAAGVRRLAITHISSRYAPGNARAPEDLLAEARKTFPETLLAEDLMILPVPRRGASPPSPPLP